MKESFFKVLKYIFVAFILCSFNTLVSANENHMNKDSDEFSMELKSSNDLQKQSKVCLPGDSGYPNCNTYVPTKQTKTLVGTKYYIQYFLGFNDLTPKWSSAQNDIIITPHEQNFNVTIPYDNLYFDVRLEYSNDIEIYCNAHKDYLNRDMKLCVTADITAEKYKVEVMNANTGEHISTYYTVTPIINNVYNDIYYQGVGVVRP